MSAEISLLKQAKEEDIENLIKLLKLKKVKGKTDLIKQVGKYLENNNYRNNLYQVAKYYKIKNFIILKNYEIENKINKNIFYTMKQNLSNKKLLELNEKFQIIINNNYNKQITGAGLAFAGLASAQASGFGVYLLATTSLGMISSVVGVTLPFFVYTALTTAISVIIGPVGWTILLGYSGFLGYLKFYKKRKLKHAIILVVYISFLRQKEIFFAEEKLKRLKE